MRSGAMFLAASAAALLLASCETATDLPQASPAAAVPTAALSDPWGPETPPFNLEVILRSPGGSGFGLVKFRQPNDDSFIINLHTWVRDLAPNNAYRLQRAVDTTVDDVCTSTAWLTLGQGLTPYAITTDATGTGAANLFRSVAAFPEGTPFDIHFQVIDDATGAVVLASECYQFVISR
jgi:hypothetical protein